MNAISLDISPETLMRLSKPVPRYTSYPSTPYFNNQVNGEGYAEWLKSLEPGSRISLYLHIPFCDRLCWFCACHTKHTLKYEPIRKYLSALYAEIRWVASRIGGRGLVTALHLGGGSPSLLRPNDLSELKNLLRSSFHFSPEAEISIEMDPNDLDDQQLDGLADFGMTRTSFGVQDFNPAVQRAINRIQTFDQTARCVTAMRKRGIGSINIDALYGLPYQTNETVAETISQILSLEPDRIALFGYAHVPWLKKHQTMIPEAALPDVVQRFEQQVTAGHLIVANRYQRIGFDHFALHDDSLAIAAGTGMLRRNFQGYTNDSADALIGLGASAIGHFPQGYVQNVTATSLYEKTVLEDQPAVAKGHLFSREDQRRAQLIEQLLCQFYVDIDAVAGSDSELSTSFKKTAAQLACRESPSMISWDGKRLELHERARPFARHFAAAFDSYLNGGTGRHSSGI